MLSPTRELATQIQKVSNSTSGLYDGMIHSNFALAACVFASRSSKIYDFSQFSITCIGKVGLKYQTDLKLVKDKHSRDENL